jgi:hypothetical protein
LKRKSSGLGLRDFFGLWFGLRIEVCGLFWFGPSTHTHARREHTTYQTNHSLRLMRSNPTSLGPPPSQKSERCSVVAAIGWDAGWGGWKVGDAVCHMTRVSF